MIYINGRFLTKAVTGVQRFAIEVVKALDKMNLNQEIVILTPSNISLELNLQNIKIIKIGKLKGNLWEQISLPTYLIGKKNYKLINLCNLGSVFNPGYVVLHDISFKTHSDHFSWKFSLYYKIITRLNITRYKHIFTVSQCSKKEIIENYKINPKDISVTYNSAEHMHDIETDFNILQKLNLNEKNFAFSIGSKSAHKNHKFIEKCAINNPDFLFVVSGDNNSVFKDEEKENLKNLIYTGRITDGEMKALYSKCAVFIFPSKYEGFGIPPLEAMEVGCRNIILSDIPVFREIYSNNVKYFDLNNEEESRNIVKKINEPIEFDEQIIKKYDWTITAEKILKDMEGVKE